MFALQGESIEITQKASGKKLSVNVVGLADDVVTIENATGKNFEVPLSSLTDASIEAIKDALAGASTQANDAFGQPLLSGNSSLWNEDAAAVAKRMGLKLESSVELSSSYRLYTKVDYLFAGAHPYCVTLYGNENGKAEQLSLVFANKGDFGSTAGFGEDHFKKVNPDREAPMSLADAIEADAEIIAAQLSKTLGEPQKQYYGEKEDKRRVQRWDLEQHSILLSTQDDEYTSVLIVSTANADAEGKVELIKDSDLKAKLIENVMHESNGDVLIQNIPMVDQGPKGYCAPATFERAMRYMEVPADMYLLATAATSEGGGTNTTLLAETSKRIIRSKARKVRELELQDDFEISKLKKYIDKGVPVLWQMCSLTPYNELANRRTKERSETEDFAVWAEDIAKEAESVVPQVENVEANHHICMVVGYNEVTNEVGVSDSWGPRYELRWVHVDIARAVTSRGGFVIDF
ncbi:MAG: C39 family peptidase [Roseibacillus sp.]